MTLCMAISLAACAYAAEPTVEEMIGTLSKKSDGAQGGVRMRSIAGPQASAGKLALSVQFEIGSANITPASRELLTKLAAAMTAPELAGERFSIEGHTDASGDANANQRLSERRAQSVQSFLEKNGGVRTGRLNAVGKGSSELADAANPQAAANRRVVVVALGAASAPFSATPGVNVAAAPAAAKESPQVTVAVPASNGAVGVIKQLRGDASISRGELSTRATEGDGVRSGDLIITSANGSILVIMNDDAQLLVRPNTRLRLAEMVAAGPVEQRSQLYDLTVGALRYVTGALGKLKPDRINFKTPAGSVGIRGTDIEIVHLAASRGLRPAGTFVRVSTGAIELKGNDGTVVPLSVNEEAFAAVKGVPLRGGGRAPATQKLDKPADVFVTNELDALVERR
jgi:outer membrane protein OmpA-like peptidoglycan-associated protein